MRAAQVSEFGPVEGIRVAEVERPEPGPGQVLVRVAAAGVNFADAGMVLGTNRRRSVRDERHSSGTSRNETGGS